MRIDVIGRHLDVTDAIRQYAEQKAARLTKFFDGTQRVQVLLEAMKHQEFQCEILVDVEKHEDFVATMTANDLYKCIDFAVDKAARQLHDFKEKLKQGRH